MLPDWVNSLGTLVTLVTGIPLIVGWIAAQAKPLRPSAKELSPRVDAGNLVSGSLREGVTHLFIRPEEPLWDDVLKALLLSVLLVALSAFAAWNAAQPIELAWDNPLRSIALTLLWALGVLLCGLWARVFAKRNYLRQMGRY